MLFIYIKTFKTILYINIKFYSYICAFASRILDDVNYRIFYNNNKTNFRMIKSDLVEKIFIFTINERLDLLSIFRFMLCDIKKGPLQVFLESYSTIHFTITFKDPDRVLTCKLDYNLTEERTNSKYYLHKLEELFFKYGDDARIMLPDYTFVSIEVDIL